MTAKKCFFACLLALVSSTGFAQEMKLVYAVDVIRHGARAPMKLMPNTHAQYHWQAGPGQLLPIGLHQEFLLGRHARDYYIINNHFLPTHYNPSLIDKVVPYSTDVSRTLQSAQAFLQGFYPLGTGPQQYENSKTPPLPYAMAILPIHFVKTEPLLPSLQASVKSMLKNTNTCTTLYNAAQKDGSLTRWSKASGFKLTGHILLDFKAVENLSDNVLTRQSLGILLPHTQDAPFAQGDEVKIAQLANACLSALYQFKLFASVTSGKLLHDIIQNMKNVTAGKTGLAYNLYSAHDTNVASLMTLFGLPVDKQPPFSSDVRLKLYRVGQSNQYVVQLTYNGIPQLFPQSICGKATQSCDFSDFQRL